jgi:putative endonuclease
MPSPTQRWGASSEEAAEAFLRRSGYRIIERNWRAHGAEIDRIAWDGDILAIIEIRARRSAYSGRPEETVRHKKQRLLVRGALAYLRRFSPKRTPMIRFDVVSVVDPRHGPRRMWLIKNAFDGRAEDRL